MEDAVNDLPIHMAQTLRKRELTPICADKLRTIAHKDPQQEHAHPETSTDTNNNMREDRMKLQETAHQFRIYS